MKTIHFEFRGQKSRMVVPEGHLSELCAEDIISGKSYPFPEFAGNKQPKLIVDIGGHAGEFAVMARINWPSSVIVVYEPNPALVDCLFQNAQEHSFQVIRAGVGPIDVQHANLRVSGYGTVANSFVDRPNQTGDTIACSIVSASQLPQPINVLKIDAEGMEVQILNALHALGRLTSIELIYVEFHCIKDRLKIENLLLPTHDLCFARVGSPHQGELLYVRSASYNRLQDGKVRTPAAGRAGI